MALKFSHKKKPFYFISIFPETSINKYLWCLLTLGNLLGNGNMVRLTCFYIFSGRLTDDIKTRQIDSRPSSGFGLFCVWPERTCCLVIYSCFLWSSAVGPWSEECKIAELSKGLEQMTCGKKSSAKVLLPASRVNTRSQWGKACLHPCH